MARRTKEQALETRDNILKAAINVFIARGVAKASLADIAQHAAVTRGAVYWHFKNKLDLFEALHEQLHGPLIEAILNDLENDHPDPIRQLEDLCINLLKDLSQDKNSRAILTIFLLRCDYSGEMAQILDRQYSRKVENFKLFSRYFERAKIKGHLPEESSPEILTSALSCYMAGIVHEYIRAPKLMTLEKQAEPLIRQFFLGVAGV